MTATWAASEEALELAETIGDRYVSRSCRLWLANAQTYRGDLADAVAQFREVVEEAVSAHDVLLQVIGLVGQSFAEALHGHVLAAQTLADEALDCSSTQFDYYDIPSYGAVTFSRLAAGDSAAAWTASEVAKKVSGGNPVTRGVFLVWAAQAAHTCGDLAEARRLAEGAVSLRSGVYQASALAIRAYVEVAQEELDHADADARQALSIASNVGGEVLVPEILECFADIARIEGSHRDAVRLLGMAAAARQRMGSCRFRVFDAAHDASVAELRNALGNKDFDEAWAEGESLSTEEAIAYVQRGHGERKRPASGWASLTPTERDVVRLVGEGLGNKDVAARLFVSPRTVESHLTHVYTKLGTVLQGPTRARGSPARRRRLEDSRRNLFRHTHPPCLDDDLAEFDGVDRVEPDVDPVVSHVGRPRQHELVRLGGNQPGALLLGEGETHHRLVAGERQVDDLPDAEFDPVADHHLVGPGQGRGYAPNIIDGDHVRDVSRAVRQRR